MEKYPHLPTAHPDHWRPLDDHEFDEIVDRDPYEGRRPGPEPHFSRGLWLGTGFILVAIVAILAVTAIVRW